jgi:hypothetical protein
MNHAAGLAPCIPDVGQSAGRLPAEPGSAIELGQLDARQSATVAAGARGAAECLLKPQPEQQAERRQAAQGVLEARAEQAAAAQ